MARRCLASFQQQNHITRPQPQVGRSVSFLSYEDRTLARALCKVSGKKTAQIRPFSSDCLFPHSIHLGRKEETKSLSPPQPAMTFIIIKLREGAGKNQRAGRWEVPQICQKSRMIGCVIRRFNLQLRITQPILILFYTSVDHFTPR